jgi:phosphoglycolate phosphatase
MMARMCRRGVIFDLDGTLLDTLDDLGDSMNAALRGLGLPGHDYEFYRHAVGDGARVLAERSLPMDCREEERVARALDAMRVNYARNWRKKTKPYEGIQELLAALVARRVVLSVLTNKPHDFAQECVRHFLPDVPFAAVVGAIDGVPLKPHPGAARRVMREAGSAVESWLYVGDTNTDMRTAVAAGLAAIGCTWGFRDREELLSSGASVTIDHPSELLGHVDTFCD